jgi:hypothetical protein
MDPAIAALDFDMIESYLAAGAPPLNADGGDHPESKDCRSSGHDFKTLVSAVAMGHVGAIFSLEASRPARSNNDGIGCWSCVLSPTLVFDGDGCYDPSDFNDSLVLGMKGTSAQAELHIIRARLHGAPGARSRSRIRICSGIQPSDLARN